MDADGEGEDGEEVGAEPRAGGQKASPALKQATRRRQFIGGSDARIIMGKDEKALHRLWREKCAFR